jgi:hypothetical protein
MLQIRDLDSQIHARAKERGQRTFTLVEQDRSSVEVIAYWILMNIHTAPSEKLEHALDMCLAMREFAAVKDAD